MEEISDGSSSEEDELSLLSRRVNQLWKHKHRKFSNPKITGNHSESSSIYIKSSNKDIVCYECNEPGHYKSDCPNLQKEKPKNKFSKENKKILMETWDDSESSEAETESEDERANIALMENISDDTGSYESESDSEVEEVFSNF